jgi:hypothetical protein
MWKVLQFIFGKECKRFYPLHRRFCRRKYEAFSRSYEMESEKFWKDRLERGY